MGLTEDCWFNFKLVFLFWFLVSLTVASLRLPEEEPGTASLADGGAED
jgi:hypothetical protein